MKVTKFHKLSVIAQHREFITDLVKDAQEEGAIRSDFTSQQIADILFSNFMSVVFNWIKDETGNAKYLSRMSDFILDMFFNGARQR